jgi:hypothetical protein
VQPVPVPEQLTVRVEAGRSPAAETDLVINIIKHVIISVAPACITASRGLAAGIAPTSRDALYNGRELSINLRCRTNKEYALVPGNLTRVKQRGAVAGYRILEEGT